MRSATSFIAETGSFVPQTGAPKFAGDKAVRGERESGVASDVIVSTGVTIEEIFNPDSSRFLEGKSPRCCGRLVLIGA